jgi:hypothetical protein
MTAMPKTVTTKPALALVFLSAWFSAVVLGVAAHTVLPSSAMQCTASASASCTVLADGGTGNG